MRCGQRDSNARIAVNGRSRIAGAPECQSDGARQFVSLDVWFPSRRNANVAHRLSVQVVMKADSEPRPAKEYRSKTEVSAEDGGLNLTN